MSSLDFGVILARALQETWSEEFLGEVGGVGVCCEPSVVSKEAKEEAGGASELCMLIQPILVVSLHQGVPCSLARERDQVAKRALFASSP